MKYADMFHRVVYVNRDDPAFEEGVSPSISAEQLNEIQKGIDNALSASDTLNGDIGINRTHIEQINHHTTNVVCEILNTSVTIQTDAWTDNTSEKRIEAVYSNDLIRHDTDVQFTLSDEQKGKFSIKALDPVDGSITLFTAEGFPKVPLVFNLKIWEVRNIAYS